MASNNGISNSATRSYDCIIHYHVPAKNSSMERLPVTLELDTLTHSSSYSIYDIIISLPHDVIEDIISHDVSALIKAWPYFPPIPRRTKRIWIYGRLTKTITYIIRLDYHSHPARLYQLENPVPLKAMKEWTEDSHAQIPGPTPKWLWDYSRPRRCIW